MASKVIRLNPEEADEFLLLSEIVDSVRLIKLITEPGEVLGRIREVVVKDKYIYLMDASQQAIFLFDKTGKFISKLNKRGRGPNEYALMKSVFIDESEEFVEIVNRAGKSCFLNKYALPSFDFIERTPFISIEESSTKRIGNTYYHSTQQTDNVIEGKPTNAGLIISREGKVVKTWFEKVIKTNHSTFSPNSESLIYNNRNELFLSLMYDPTFYKLQGDSVYPEITVDFGSYAMNYSMGLKPLEEQLDYIRGTCGVAMFPVLNLNNPDLMSFSYYYKKDNQKRFFKDQDLCYYLRWRNKTYHVKRIKNDITGFPAYIYLNSYFLPSCNHNVYHRDYLIDVFIPDHQVLSGDYDSDRIEVEGIGEITPDDNPVVIMMKLKK